MNSELGKRAARVALLSLLFILVCGIAFALTGSGGQFNGTTGRSYMREETVTFSATPAFNLDTSTSKFMTLTGNVTSSTITGGVAGATYTFRICQDGAGLHSFAWPASVKTVGLISIPITAVASTC